MADLAQGVDVERHVLLHGRHRHPWYRRGLFALVCLVPILALTNLFGQASTNSTAKGVEGTLRVHAPSRVRGGLLYQVRIDVTANSTIKAPQLVLSRGFFEQMTENSTNPQPVDESSSNGRLNMSYQGMHGGQKLTVWLEFQVNPITAGTRTADVQLNDGDKPVAHVHRTLTIFP